MGVPTEQPTTTTSVQHGHQGDQAQGSGRPPHLPRHDHGGHPGPQGEDGLLQAGHPQVHLRQLQGGRRQGRGGHQARPQGRRGQGRHQERQGDRQGCRQVQGGQGRETKEASCKESNNPEEACCQETQSFAKEGCRKACCQKDHHPKEKTCCKESGCQKPCCQEACCQKPSCQETCC